MSRNALWASVLLVSLACASTESNLVQTLAEPESSPVEHEGLGPHPGEKKWHTVNPAQIQIEKEQMKDVADAMKRTYEKLLTGTSDDASGSDYKPKDKVGKAKEQADKAMAAAKMKAKEKSKKTILKVKETLKKENAAEREKAKEKAKKKLRAFAPLKGGPVQQAAMARFDAYNYKLKASKVAIKFAKKLATKDQLDEIDALAAHAHKRAKYMEAQAIKSAIQKAHGKEQLRKAAAKAEHTLKKADAQATVEAKAKPWVCTPESCRVKCKTEHCMQWCSKCVTMGTEVMKYDPISQKLVVSHMRKESVDAPVRDVPDIVAYGKNYQKELDDRNKEATDWVDRKLNEVKTNVTNTAANEQSAKVRAHTDSVKAETAKLEEKDAPTLRESAGLSKKQSMRASQKRESSVLKWAKGVKKPSNDKAIAAEIHIKIRERQSSMIHAAKTHGAGFLESQTGTSKPK